MPLTRSQTRKLHDTFDTYNHFDKSDQIRVERHDTDLINAAAQQRKRKYYRSYFPDADGPFWKKTAITPFKGFGTDEEDCGVALSDLREEETDLLDGPNYQEYPSNFFGDVLDSSSDDEDNDDTVTAKTKRYFSKEPKHKAKKQKVDFKKLNKLMEKVANKIQEDEDLYVNYCQVLADKIRLKDRVESLESKIRQMEGQDRQYNLWRDSYTTSSYVP